MDFLNILVEYITTFLKSGKGLSLGAQVFLIVFLTLIINHFLEKFLNRLLRKLKRKEFFWNKAIVDAAKKPVKILVWVLGITFAAQLVGKDAGITMLTIAHHIRSIGIAASITWFILRFLKKFEVHLFQISEEKDAKLDKTTADAVIKLLRITVFITFGLIMLQALGFSIDGVLAFGGISGIAVGFASKDLLSNFFGTLIIYLDKPFAVGDWISSPDKSIEGTVERIGWRMTVIRTFEKRPLYVPNALFTTISIENPSRMSHRRIRETIGLRYDDMSQVRNVVASVKEMLKKHPEIDESQTLIVNLNTFSESSVDFFIYTFTHTTNWIKFHEIKQDVMLKIAEIVEKCGAEMAFPTTTLHIPEGLEIEHRNQKEE